MTTTLQNISSLKDLYYFLENAKADVSFWGNRYVSINAGKDSCALDLLPARVWDLVKKNPEFDEIERGFGKKIKEKIKKLYKDSEKAAAIKNCVTRIFFAIMEYWIENIKEFGYGIRFHWFRDKKVFDYYTQSQYQRAFGFSPGRGAQWSEAGSPDRWLPPGSI